jgi:soluble lytic murein transglycosylase-like protein
VTAPILRSAALQQALALTPVRPPSTTSATFASTLRRAEGKPTPVPKANRALPVEHIPAGVPQDVSGPVPYLNEIKAAATQYGVDPALLAAVVKQESNFNPKARSGAGAKGLTQLMDATARGLGVTNSFDPEQSLEGGAKFLGGLLKEFHGDESLALAAYNAGPAAVQKYGGIPPYQETQRYVPKVLGYAAQFRRIIATS